MFANKHPFSTRGKVRFGTVCVSHHQREAEQTVMLNAETCVKNTTAKGDIAEQAIVLALLKVGKTVLRPVSNGLRYDLVVDNLDGTIMRIQCKTGTLKCAGGVVRFRPRSADARRPNGVPYHGQIDAFGIYCPQNEQVYLVPIAELGSLRSEVSLRLLPARSGQEMGIRYASVYALGPRGGDAVDFRPFGCDADDTDGQPRCPSSEPGEGSVGVATDNGL
jgi:PD-(D/E)XK endonuclease